MEIRPYLTFKGECQEAIELYTRAFQTKAFEITRFADLPQNPENPMPIPENQMNWILQASIRFGNNFMRLSDCLGELNDAPTERIAIVVESSTSEVRHAFAVLADGGRVGIPLQRTFFSPCHGVVFDKFGIMWNLLARL